MFFSSFNMFKFKVFMFVISICMVKSEVEDATLCKNDYRDANNAKINVEEYCFNKLCIEKCCGKDEFTFLDGTCYPLNLLNKHRTVKTQYKAINILSSMNVNKTSTKPFYFIYNHRNVYNCTSEHLLSDEYEISEDGSLMRQESDGMKKWHEMENLTFCIDYRVYSYRDKNEDKFGIKIGIREVNVVIKDRDQIEVFETVGVIISSFFLLLLLIVYCLLPDLRNLSGLVLMAYTFSLLFAYIVKLVTTFNVKNPPVPWFCKSISPILYFAFMSSIFWLSVISWDVWWGLRQIHTKRRPKREELVRFLWYGLYAWGTPLLITAIVAILDNIPNLAIEKRPFEDCFHAGPGFDYYFRIPIGILIIINVLLFIVTVYNIWQVKRGVQNSNRSKKQNAKFSTYAKLFTIMGVNWCTELIQTDNVLWLYIVINIYNIFVGVALFYLFVCDKKVLASLCKKFNIHHTFIKYLDTETSQRNRSSNTRSTLVMRSTVNSKTKELEPSERVNNENIYV